MMDFASNRYIFKFNVWRRKSKFLQEINPRILINWYNWLFHKSNVALKSSSLRIMESLFLEFFERNLPPSLGDRVTPFTLKSMYFISYLLIHDHLYKFFFVNSDKWPLTSRNLQHPCRVPPNKIAETPP